MEKPSINELPDDLLLKILSSLPMFKEAIETHLISKRWEGLWKLMPDLTFDDKSYPRPTFALFVYRSLLLNNSQGALERLHLKLRQYYSNSDINAWVQAAVDRSVREVEIDLFGKKTLELPSCLSSCKTLETLILRELTIEVVPFWFRLPSLKTLHLLSVKFSGGQSVESLLRICPVLEVLIVDQTKVDNLRSLSIDKTKRRQNMEKPSIINKLPDKLLVKILSSLSIKQSVETNLLSKRWRGLSRLLPDLKFDDNADPYLLSFTSFVYRSFVFNKAQVLERFDLNFSHCYWPSSHSHINTWVQIAVNRSVREVRIDLFGKTLELPSCLSTCTTLKTLILHELSIEVVPPWFLLPSLKTLHLLSVKFWGDKSISSFLRCCPVLEDLFVVDKTEDDNVMIFDINVPTLKSLVIDKSKGKRAYVQKRHGFVITAPSLRNLNFKDTFSNFLMFEYMPEVIKADIEVICDQSDKFIGSLTSIQHLSLCCLTSKTPYPRGTLFPFLKHLELCTCSAGWSNLLACMLNDTPNLRSLKLKSKHGAGYDDPMNQWNEPPLVPECLSSHLEILEWRKYEGTMQERKVAAYILANATFLKVATFSTRCRNKYHGMFKKLKKMYRVSETCQLVF